MYGYMRPVRCVETGKEYPSATAAALDLGLNHVLVSRCCHETHRTTGGYHFEFADERQFCYPNLRKEIHEQGVTMKRMAQEIYVSDVSLYKRMNGKVPFTKLEKQTISRFLKQKIEYLFEEKSEE